MREIFGLLSTFVAFSALLFSIWHFGPLPEGSQRPVFPTDLKGLRMLANSLANYKNDHWTYTMVLFSTAYLFKQTFAIPGSFFMNLLAGALCSTLPAIALVTVLTCTGASLCFVISSLFARPIVERCLLSRLEALRSKIAMERRRLFLFLLSARVFPFTPHWLLNVTSPFLGVPLSTHASTVAIGLIPYNTLCVRAGRVLSEVNSIGDVFDALTLSELLIVSLVLLAIARYSKRRGAEWSTSDGVDRLPTEHVAVD